MGSAPQSNNMEMDHKAPIVYTHFTPHIESLLYSSLIIAGQSFVLPMIFEMESKKKKGLTKNWAAIQSNNQYSLVLTGFDFSFLKYKL